MKTWYIRNNDEHLGPYSIEELKLLGLYSDDYVWKDGLPAWTKACQVPELTELMITVEHAFYPKEPSQKANHLVDCPSFSKLNKLNRSFTKIFGNSVLRKFFGSQRSATR